MSGHAYIDRDVARSSLAAIFLIAFINPVVGGYPTPVLAVVWPLSLILAAYALYVGVKTKTWGYVIVAVLGIVAVQGLDWLAYLPAGRCEARLI